MRHILILLCVLSMAGCAGFAKISNEKRVEGKDGQSYAFGGRRSSAESEGITVVLAFSGGGTRAAALSYGVLAALRDTRIMHHGAPIRVLDEIDLISAVSGGSFTAAYYGLHHDGIFKDFEDRFLRQDVSGALLKQVLGPVSWFSNDARSEMVVEFYKQTLFGEATFADLLAAGKPFILINASDLGGGVRFSFLQNYFDLLCSDLTSFPVARAITASSAVPILFSPVVLKNHGGCHSEAEANLQSLDVSQLSAQMRQAVEGLRSYADKKKRPFIHLVDGGITDNLGVMAIYEIVETAGGIKAFIRQTGGRPGRQILFIVVDAATHSKHNIDQSNQVPSLEDTVNAMTDIQLHRYNAATLDLMRESLEQWARDLSAKGKPVKSYFVYLGLDSLSQSRRDYFDKIPTNFSLTDEQVDKLVALGSELIQANAVFQRFIRKNR